MIHLPIQTALWPLQQALYQRLNNDTALSALVTGVYDKVPADQPKPYIRIGEPIADPFSDKSSYGEEMSVVVHTWSAYPGKKESYDIINTVLRAVYSSPLSLDGGFSIAKIDGPRSQVFDDIDGYTQHGVVRLKFWIK